MSNFYFNLEDICIIITGFPRSSFGKESAFNAGDPVQFLGLEELLEKGWATHSSILGLPLWLSWKESACHVGDLGSIPGLGRSRYSGLENSMDCIVQRVAKCQT